MLVLTRRVGESIHIGDGVIVKVTSIRGNQVSIGVTAPPGTSIHRHEVAERIKAESTKGQQGVTQPLPLHQGRDQ